MAWYNTPDLSLLQIHSRNVATSSNYALAPFLVSYSSIFLPILITHLDLLSMLECHIATKSSITTRFSASYRKV